MSPFQPLHCITLVCKRHFHLSIVGSVGCSIWSRSLLWRTKANVRMWKNKNKLAKWDSETKGKRTKRDSIFANKSYGRRKMFVIWCERCMDQIRARISIATTGVNILCTQTYYGHTDDIHRFRCSNVSTLGVVRFVSLLTTHILSSNDSILFFCHLRSNKVIRSSSPSRDVACTTYSCTYLFHHQTATVASSNSSGELRETWHRCCVMLMPGKKYSKITFIVCE